MLKIGILGSQGKTETIDLLRKFFQNSNLKASILQSIYEEDFDPLRYLEALSESHFDVVIIKLSLRALRQHCYENVKFDILIYTTGENGVQDEKVEEEEMNILHVIHDEDYIIVNADEKLILKKLHGKKAKIITYGFNAKASVTASSIDERDFSPGIQCCIQRSLFTLSGQEIEPQEFPIRIHSDINQNMYSILSAVIVALLNDVEVDKLQKILP